MTIKVFNGSNWNSIAQRVNVFRGGAINNWVKAKKISVWRGSDASGYWSTVYPDLPLNTSIPDVQEPVYVGGTAQLDNYFVWDFSNEYRQIDTLSYQWQRSSNLSTWSNITSATSPTYVVPSADKGYYLRCQITATNERGSVTITSYASFKVIDVPGAVLNLAASNPTQPFNPPLVVWAISWSAPSDNGGSAITDYEYVTDLDAAGTTYNFGTWLSTSNTTSTSIMVLGGTQAYARVRAVNAAGDGPYTQITLNSSPQAPTNFSGTATSTTTATLNWSAPAFDGGAPVTGYELQRNQDPNTPQADWIDLGLVTTRNVTGMNANTTYYFRVRAYQTYGAQKIIGSYAQVAVTTLASNPPTPIPVPSPPTEPPGVTPLPPTSPPPSPIPVPVPTPLPPPISPPPGGIPIPPPNPRPPLSIGFDTKILTVDGYIPIQNIMVGDQLISIDISEIPTDGSTFDILNWSSETFTNNGFATTNVVDIVAAQIVGPAIQINGDVFSQNHSILIRKNGEYKFLDANLVDESYEVFDYDTQDWGPVTEVIITENSTITVYTIDCEPYDIFFTNNALVYNRKEFLNE